MNRYTSLSPSPNSPSANVSRRRQLFILLFILMTIISCFAYIFVAATDKVGECTLLIKSGQQSSNKQCINRWRDLKPLLRPTQEAIGYAWIKHKLEKGDFASKARAQTQMDNSIAPAVLGPDNKIYLLDEHHTLAALDYSLWGADTLVKINIVCDKRQLPSMRLFWQYMVEHDLVSLVSSPRLNVNALPVKISPFDLPQSFSFTVDKPYSLSAANIGGDAAAGGGVDDHVDDNVPVHVVDADTISSTMRDDPWRSLAGFSRKVLAGKCLVL